MNEKIQELGELNKAFYELFCKYDQYKDKLTESMAKYMAEKLFSTYKEEFGRIFAEYYIDREREKFENGERRAELIPKRWRAWWSLFILRRRNRAAELIEEKVEKETAAFFAECKKKLERKAPQTVSQTGVNDQSEAAPSKIEVKKPGERAAPRNVVRKKPEAAAQTPPIPNNTTEKKAK